MSGDGVDRSTQSSAFAWGDVRDGVTTGGPPGDWHENLPRVRDPIPGDGEFALCLTHDVDRPYKGVRSLYYATRERPSYHLRSALSSANPYWQFEEIRNQEDDLGVRSAFYFLDEQHLLFERPASDWLSPTNWVQHLGRYDLDAPELVEAIRELDAGGWEIGLHGSYHSPTDRDRLAAEKSTIETVLGGPIVGGRQHYLRLSIPETWRHHRAIGLRYDASLGSGTERGFQYGYRPLRPFDDDFLAFPLTLMEQALPDPGNDVERAVAVCDRLLREAAENDAVMTALWHPRYFNGREFPGYREVYRRLVERAIELGAWIGTPAAFCDAVETDCGRDRGRNASRSTSAR